MIVQASDFDLLQELHEWVARGLPICQLAQRKAIPQSRFTYRLNKYGLDDCRAVGLVDRVTRIPFPTLVETGQMRRADPSPAVAA